MLRNSNNTKHEVTTQLQQTESKLSNVFLINIYIYQTFVNLALLQFFLFLPDHEKCTFLAPVVGVRDKYRFLYVTGSAYRGELIFSPLPNYWNTTSYTLKKKGKI